MRKVSFWAASAALVLGGALVSSAQTTTLTFQQGVNGYSGTADTFFQTGDPVRIRGEAFEWE